MLKLMHNTLQKIFSQDVQTRLSPQSWVKGHHEGFAHTRAQEYWSAIVEVKLNPVANRVHHATSEELH